MSHIQQDRIKGEAQPPQGQQNSQCMSPPNQAAKGSEPQAEASHTHPMQRQGSKVEVPATRLVEEPAQNDRGFADFLSGPDIVDPEQNHPLSPRAQPRYPELSESDRVKSHQPQAHGFDRRFTIFDRYPLYPDTSFDLGPRSDLRDEEVPDDVKELMMRKKEPTVFKKNLGRREWRPKKAKSPEAADNGDDAVMDDWIDFSKTA